MSLVALPLTLGIALASGVPPMSGVLAAIIGGLITTLFRGSYLTINGPAAGLIVVILNGVTVLGDDQASGFSYVLAAIVVAGLLMAFLGVLKMGKIGDLFPSTVITGLLATIGIIILVKQLHVALGNNAQTGSVLETIRSIPSSILDLNPIITFISLVSLFLLVIHSQIKNRFLKSIPAPLQVMLISILLVFVFSFIGKDGREFMGAPIALSQEYLVSIPDNPLDNIVFPNFSKIALPEFWLVVISLTLIGTIESLVSAKAVDKLDHYKRRTNLNKDLFAIGLGTAVSGFLGGLPVIAVIVRSSVNINHNAKTKWSNMYHGLFLLSFVFLFPWLIREIPLASLATILVYTGYKLASPAVFRATLMRGWEQLLIMLVSLFVSLTINLLAGIVIGIVFTLLLHWIRSGLQLRTFWRHLLNTEINVSKESKNIVHVDIKGIANFAIMLKLINSLKALGNEYHYVVNFSRTKLVDSTVLDFIHEHREKYFTQSDFEFVGLDVHKTSSPHPLALHVLERPMQKRLTGRQNEIFHFAGVRGYRYSPEISWNVEHFEKFRFMDYHLVEYHRNRLSGSFDRGINWTISDLTYNDGILMASDEHHITIMILNLPREITEFSITKENTRQIKELVRSAPALENKDIMDDLTKYLSENASYYIEGTGNSILIYRKIRLLSAKEIIALHDYVEGFCQVAHVMEEATRE